MFQLRDQSIGWIWKKLLSQTLVSTPYSFLAWRLQSVNVIWKTALFFSFSLNSPPPPPKIDSQPLAKPLSP